MTQPSKVKSDGLPKRVLVTGGGTGLGLAIATALVEAGSEVFICGRRRRVLEEAAEISGATPLSGDITGPPDGLLRATGQIDGLVHNAGSYIHSEIGDWIAHSWQDMFAVHVRGPAILSQAFAAQCKGPGSIVAISSTLGARPASGAAAYSAAKAGMLSLIRSLAIELAPVGIRANAILAGVVPTDMTTTPRGNLTSEEQLEALRRLHPLGRLGKPEEIAQAVLGLMGNPWVSGAELAVDGGLLVS
jgi:NAD(P)-dependent dehydrogenase (short-subunit alcohol dehydrogenase family)